MSRRRELLRWTAVLAACRWGPAAARGDESYDDARADVAAGRARQLARWRAGERGPSFRRRCDRLAVDSVLRLSRFWLGTRWGLGLPQIQRPGDGRVNCGTFVGRLLADAGFRVDVRKLQRQPSALIVRTFAPPERIQRFWHAPLPAFLAAVEAMGPGLFIIGLDLHVGLLVRRPGGELRFIHASILTASVVDEPAADALLIGASAYRVVGKALGARNLESWLTGQPIAVVGDF